jgi:hypothetical protein
MDEQRVKRINVTDLTPSEQRQLFAECFTQEGFTAFIKTAANQQTHYTFKYKN